MEYSLKVAVQRNRWMNKPAKQNTKNILHNHFLVLHPTKNFIAICFFAGNRDKFLKEG
jgi:hypothetical protein